MDLTFDSKNIVKTLAILALLLVIAHVISHVAIHHSINPLSEVMIEKFSLEGEANFPAFFSSFLLLFSGFLFLVISKGRRQQEQTLQNKTLWKFWGGLSAIFVFLSLDEAVQLHEKLDTELIWSSFDTSGLLAWPWVILYASLATVLLALYFRFWLQLPLGFRIAYAVAAGVYIGSALGFEMLEALEYTTQGGVTTKYLILTTVEEIMEMAAIIFLIHTNLRFITTHIPNLNISFSPAGTLVQK